MYIINFHGGGFPRQPGWHHHLPKDRPSRPPWGLVGGIDANPSAACPWCAETCHGAEISPGELDSCQQRWFRMDEQLQKKGNISEDFIMGISSYPNCNHPIREIPMNQSVSWKKKGLWTLLTWPRITVHVFFLWIQQQCKQEQSSRL